MKDDKIYIANILDSIQKIEDFTKEITKDNFVKDQMMQSATIFQLALIGEEANKISQETKFKIDLPWKEIVGFRNMAFHDYVNLEIDIVWDTVQKDIPELKVRLLKDK